MLVRSKAPVRIDFAGGWTDVDIFAKGSGGAVVNATINKYVTGSVEVYDSEPIQTLSGKEGISVSYESDLPSGSGLGTSSALNVVWLSLIKSRITSADDKAKIAGLAYDLERMLGILGGKQDQFASALGGINFMRFADEVEVQRIDASESIIKKLQERLVLCYTGKPRLSSNIHQNVWGAYRNGNRETVDALYSLREIAINMRDAILAEDITEFGNLLSKNWMYQQRLDPSVTNSLIEEMFSIAEKSGASYGKACGAGGGGCVLFLADEGKKAKVSEALSNAGARVIDFEFEFEGLTVEEIG